MDLWYGVFFLWQVTTTIDADKFNEWKQDSFEPEEFFVEMLEVIDGVTDIEKQTYKVNYFFFVFVYYFIF